MTSKSYPEALNYAGAIETASADRAQWSAGELAAIKKIAGQGIGPVLQM